MLGLKIPELLRIGDRIAVLPIIHGSGQCALAVRRWMLENDFDVVAVPLPPSFRECVEAAVLELPKPSIVIQPTHPELGQSFENTSPYSQSDELSESFGEPQSFGESNEPWEEFDDNDEGDEGDEGDDPVLCSYVPVDPCQPVIMAIRAAMGERVPREVRLRGDVDGPRLAAVAGGYFFRQGPGERGRSRNPRRPTRIAG